MSKKRTNARSVQQVRYEVSVLSYRPGALRRVRLSNAKRNFPMADGGKLAIHARTESQFATIEVSDSGGGIPAGIDIWAPFTTTKSRGSGLGLMIVRQIVTDHGGTISYAVKSGQGTTFRLTVPLASSQ